LHSSLIHYTECIFADYLRRWADGANGAD